MAAFVSPPVTAKELQRQALERRSGFLAITRLLEAADGRQPSPEVVCGVWEAFGRICKSALARNTPDDSEATAGMEA